uniref:Uncharacterized protein n=1 Tax=Zea mays TaxID=4577 RepID=A0A804NQJ2_MAIZE
MVRSSARQRARRAAGKDRAPQSASSRRGKVRRRAGRAPRELEARTTVGEGARRTESLREREEGPQAGHRQRKAAARRLGERRGTAARERTEGGAPWTSGAGGRGNLRAAERNERPSCRTPGREKIQARSAREKEERVLAREKKLHGTRKKWSARRDKNSAWSEENQGGSGGAPTPAQGHAYVRSRTCAWTVRCASSRTHRDGGPSITPALEWANRPLLTTAGGHARPHVAALGSAKLRTAAGPCVAVRWIAHALVALEAPARC